jgi:tRNA-modifying protein YgfZ
MTEFWLNHLLAEGAEFADGRVAAFRDASPSTETALCDLSYMGLIQIEGDDAATFLHAQLTNDVLALGHDHAQWNGWCSPKGRLLTTFLQWRAPAPGGTIFQMLPKTLQPAIQKRLSMFVLRAKAKISDASGQQVLFGVCGKSAHAIVGKHIPTIETISETPLSMRRFEHSLVISLSSSRVLIAVDAAYPDAAIRLWKSLAAEARPQDENTWRLAEIREGIASVDVATQDMFVPQMVNFELTGGVSFKKGCYPGQEIVARTQYRGILKRRMVHVAFQSKTIPERGAAIYSPTFPDQAAGNIVVAARVGNDRLEALVVAQLDAIRATSANQLFADAEFTQPMQLLPLPYNIADL